MPVARRVNDAPALAQASSRNAPFRSSIWFSVLLTALVSLWPAVLNGGPIWMPDTPSYMRAADAAYAKFFDVRTDWSAKSEWQTKHEYTLAAPTTSGPPPSSEPAVTLKGRSIYYGALLYAADLAGSLWWVLLVQATLVGLCITLSVRTLRRALGHGTSDSSALTVGLGLAFATPLGFFVSYLMPDIFGGLALLSMMNLLFLSKQLSRRAQAFFLAVLAYALLSHNLNMMLAGLLLLGLLTTRVLWRRELATPAILSVAACLALGFAGQTAFDWTVKRLTGAAPIRPPFVAMRLIADGPGIEYLKDHCDRRPFIYCRINIDQQPYSDTLLWSLDPQRSLFRGLSYADQRTAASQQTPFVLAVLADRPLAVISALSVDVVEQIFRFDLRGFNYSIGMRERYASAVPNRLLKEMRSTRAYQEKMIVRPTELLTALITLLSLVAIVLFLVRSRHISELGHIRAACFFILLAVSLNAALSGALSGAKGRYQMRLIWILPLIAAGIVAGRFNVSAGVGARERIN